jgi:hypothetical protein
MTADITRSIIISSKCFYLLWSRRTEHYKLYGKGTESTEEILQLGQLGCIECLSWQGSLFARFDYINVTLSAAAHAIETKLSNA